MSSTDSSYETDYSCAKVCCRLSETGTSGLITSSLPRPFIAFLLRLPLFLFPLFIGAPFISLLEAPLQLTTYYPYFSLGYGVIIASLVISLHSVVWLLIRRDRCRTADITVSHSPRPRRQYLFQLFPDRRDIINILVQGVTSGALCGLALAALLPSQLSALFNNFWIPIFIFSWITVCLAQLCLTSAPPIETAVPTVQTHTLLQLEFLSRPLHVLILLFLAVILTPFSRAASLLLYCIVCITPLLWLVGLVPPSHQLIPLLAERCVTLLFGGSALPSQICILVMCVTWWLCVSLISLIPCDITALVVAGAISYLLSLNLFGWAIHAMFRIASLVPSYSKIVLFFLPYKPHLSLSGKLTSAALLSLSLRYVILPVACLSLLSAAHIAASLLLSSSPCHSSSLNNITHNCTVANISMETSHLTQQEQLFQIPAFYWLFLSLGVVSFLPLLACYLLSSIQSRTALCGLINNPFYPAGVYNELDFEAYIQHSWLVKTAATTVQIMREFISRVISMLFLGFFLYSSRNNCTPSFLHTISVARALHLVWRAPLSLSLEISLSVCLDLLLAANRPWINLSVGVHLLIVGVSLGYLALLASQLRLILTYLIWYILTRAPASLTYLRREKILLVSLSLFFLPPTLILLPLSSLLTLTLIPIFTLPIFIPSYPRTSSFWPPQPRHSSWGCKDAVFYEEACPEVCRVFRRLVGRGVLLSPSCGQMYLIRYEDRIIILTVSEVGYQYLGLSYRGLELKGTSCHETEATQIDDILEMERTSNSRVANLFNRYLLYLVTPISHCVIDTYSEAKSSLRGVLNAKSTTHKCQENFSNCFAWLLIREVVALAEERKLHFLSQPKHCSKTAANQQDNPTDNTTQVNREQDHKNMNRSTDKNESSAALPNYRQVWSTGYSDGRQTPDSIYSVTGELGLASVEEVESILDLSLPKQNISDDTCSHTSSGDAADNRQSKHSLHTNSIDNRVRLASILPDSWLQTGVAPGQCVDSLQPALLNKFCCHWKDNSNNGLDWSEVESLIGRLTSCVSAVVHPHNNSTANKLTGTQICKNFEGQFPWSEGLSWLTNAHTLQQLAVKAYRYALKLTIDEVVLMEETTDESQIESLIELDTNWHLDCLTGSAWRESVLAATPHLFLLSRNTRCTKYYTHVLTLKPQLVHVARLQPESLHGMWSSQLLELLYLKNEEEERYSVQQEEHLLRNISIQAGDSPVGYPVFSSAPLYA